MGLLLLFKQFSKYKSKKNTMYKKISAHFEKNKPKAYQSKNFAFYFKMF